MINPCEITEDHDEDCDCSECEEAAEALRDDLLDAQIKDDIL